MGFLKTISTCFKKYISVAGVAGKAIATSPAANKSAGITNKLPGASPVARGLGGAKPLAKIDVIAQTLSREKAAFQATSQQGATSDTSAIASNKGSGVTKDKSVL